MLVSSVLFLPLVLSLPQQATIPQEAHPRSELGVRIVVPAAPAPTNGPTSVRALSAAAEARPMALQSELRTETEFDLHGILAQSTVIQDLDGLPTAIGPSYRANFSEAGLEFTPQMPIDREGRYLHYRLESIHLGGAAFEGLDLWATPSIDESREAVVFDRGLGVEELYQPRLEGLEQSFVFANLPDQRGELIVRGRLDSDFTTHTTGESGSSIVLGDAAAGGVRLSKVLGRDAAGSEVAGEMRLVGNQFELSLPAEWVAQAELPLVLDPIFGSIVSLTPGSYIASNPDMAYGEKPTAVQAVAFERVYSSTDTDIYNIELSSNVLINSGIKILEGNILPTSANPAIGFSRLHRQYLTVWEQRDFSGDTGDIYGRSTFLSGQLSNAIPIASSSLSEINPRVGSEATFLDDDVIVVWNTVGAIKATQVTLLEGVHPFTLGEVTIESSTNNSEAYPDISASGGTTGVYVIAWEKDYGLDRDIGLQAFDRNLNSVSDKVYLPTIGPDEIRVSVDGGDGVFMLAYMRDAALGLENYDIHAVRVLFSSAQGLTGFQTVLIDPADNELDRHPAVGFTGNRFYVAWEDTYNGAGYDIVYVGLDASGLEICEPRSPVTSTGDTNVFPDFAPRFAGGGEGNIADLIFQRKITSGSDPQIAYRSLGTLGGPVTNTGGGCGATGTIELDGEFFVGNQDIKLRLKDIDPGASLAILNWGAPSLPVSCGSCLFKPFKNVIFVTPIQGQASVAFPLPCAPVLANKTAEFQWTVLFTGASPCAVSPNISHSDRIEAVISY